MITFFKYNNNSIYVELPDPELRDTHASNKNFITLISRDGSVRTIFNKLGTLQNVITTHFSFRNVKQTQAIAFKTFIKSNKNEYLEYLDYNSETWICFINDESLTFTNVTQDNRINIDFTLDMWETP